MLAKRIIPCLDVKDGRVVKGVNFVGLRDAGDPVELAKVYSKAGADEIVFLDITATHENRDTIADVVRRTCREVFVPVTVGGGIRTVDDFRDILRAGADKISVNSAAVHNPELISAAAQKYGLLFHRFEKIVDTPVAQRFLRIGKLTVSAQNHETGVGKILPANSFQ